MKCREDWSLRIQCGSSEIVTCYPKQSCVSSGHTFSRKLNAQKCSQSTAVADSNHLPKILSLSLACHADSMPHGRYHAFGVAGSLTIDWIMVKNGLWNKPQDALSGVSHPCQIKALSFLLKAAEVSFESGWVAEGLGWLAQTSWHVFVGQESLVQGERPQPPVTLHSFLSPSRRTPV